MKLISTKEYNKLKKAQSDYLDLLMRPLQGVFEKVTDDDLLRENGLLNAENEKLNNILIKIKEDIEDIKSNHFKRYDDEVYKLCDNILEKIKEVDER
jgi:hypothetical protein